VEEGDGYAATLVNFRFIAKSFWTTHEAKQAMDGKCYESLQDTNAN
jgi:hypothetical protein